MDVLSLTETEAEERAALLAVQRYDIDVDLTGLPEGPEVRCVSTIAFTCSEPGASSFVDCAAHVVSATLNGRPLGQAARGRLPLEGLAERNTLVVETVQDDTTTGEGVHRAVDPADGEVYLWTSFEPDQARFVWACFDQPDLKAPHAFTVTAPAAWTVVSNTGDPRIEAVEDGVRRWSFPDTPPLSTYNPVVAGGPFYELRREGAGHDLGIFSRQSLRRILERDADEIFTVTGQGLEFFGRVFAMPFPQQKYDQVFLPEFGGAMENYGCVTWSDAFLRRASPTPAENELFAKVLLHEMAHMWFGNIVTMRWWDGLWLNEAFAEFACHWAAVRATRYGDAWASQLAGEALEAYLADQGPTSHPIHQPIRDVAQATSIFDAITYPKGATALHQLMTYVGEGPFQAGMAAYFAEHAWGNTTRHDLMAALEAASGRDLGRWSTAWLETAGTDRLTLEHEGEGGHALVAEPPTGQPRPHVLAIGSYRTGPSGLEPVGHTRVEVAGRRTPVTLPEADFHLVNDDYLTFATMRPDAASLPILLEHTAGLPAAISRAVSVATVWDMLQNGEASAAQTVGCLTSVLGSETAEAVVEPFLRLAWEAALLWAPEAESKELCRTVAATCRVMAEDPARRQVALRGLARTAVDEGDFEALRSAAGDDVDLHWRALVRQAELGPVSQDEIDELLDRDPDPDAWVRAVTVRAASPAEADKAEVWRTVVADRKVPVSSISLISQAFWRPGQDEVLRPYGDRYLEALPSLHESGMIPAMSYSFSLFPVVAVDEEFLQHAEEVAGQVAPVVGKAVVERVDEVRRMLAARGAATSAPGR